MLGLGSNIITNLPPISTFRMSTVSNLEVFLKNGGDQTLNSGNIAQWNDLSGNNNHAVQTTAGFQPQADGGGALLDGTDDRLDFTSGLNLGRFHLFMVLDLDSLTNMTLIGSSTNSGNFIRITSADGYRHKCRNGGETVIFTYTSGKTISSDTKFLYEVTRINSEIEVFKDNGDHLNVTPASGGNSSDPANGFVVNQWFTQQNNSTNINGHVYEVVLFSETLVDATEDLAKVRNDIISRNGL